LRLIQGRLQVVNNIELDAALAQNCQRITRLPSLLVVVNRPFGHLCLHQFAEAGHWKVDFIRKWVDEKALDTSLAVDMVTFGHNYNVGIVVFGDADSIPSVRYMKNKEQHIGVIEFIKGSPPEARGRTSSSRLKEHADFVTRIYETELLRHNFAVRRNT